MNKLLNDICAILNVSPSDVISKTRKEHIVFARHIFCYYARTGLMHTWADIGDFINRHHSTAIMAVNAYNNINSKLFESMKEKCKDVMSSQRIPTTLEHLTHLRNQWHANLKQSTKMLKNLDLLINQYDETK